MSVKQVHQVGFTKYPTQKVTHEKTYRAVFRSRQG